MNSLAVLFILFFVEVAACPFKNIDLLIPVRENYLPSLSLLLNSINTFMPCRNTIHILIEKGDAGKSIAWIPNSDRDGNKIIVHIFDYPASVPSISKSKGGRVGYILQAWAMMWADKYSESTGAEYIMLLDTDVIFAMPVTCASIFDENGKLYQMSWAIEPQIGFRPSCQSLLGGSCKWSYMSNLPFVMPVRAFPELRKYISENLKPGKNMSFDSAFNSWSSTNNWKAFSQFVVMGEFMKRKRPQEVRQVHCPFIKSKPEDTATTNGIVYDGTEASMERLFNQSPATIACRGYIPYSIHYGWIPQGYLGSNLNHRIYSDPSWETKDLGEFKRYNKFNTAIIDNLQEIVLHGYCLKLSLFTPLSLLPPYCEKNMSSSVHPIVDLYYGMRQLPWATVVKTFSDSSDALCSARHLTTRKETI